MAAARDGWGSNCSSHGFFNRIWKICVDEMAQKKLECAVEPSVRGVMQS